MSDERDRLAEQWREVHEDCQWCAPWSKALAGLTAEQAAWRPGPSRHSIWQIAKHLVFWRDYVADRAQGRCERLSEEEIERRNFEESAELSERAWAETVAEVDRSHGRLREAILDPASDLKNLRSMAIHDSYHFGQVMYLRAMQGLAPIE